MERDKVYRQDIEGEQLEVSLPTDNRRCRICNSEIDEKGKCLRGHDELKRVERIDILGND